MKTLSYKGVRLSAKIVVSVLTVGIFVGCAGTRVRTVELRKPDILRTSIGIERVLLDPNNSRLANVGTFKYGEYNEKDQANLKESLEKSLGQLMLSGPVRHKIFVIIRRFLIVTTSSRGVAVACVTWAITTNDGKLLFDEQFYASTDVFLVGTIGQLKNDIHKGIIERILQTALWVAASGRAQISHQSPNTFNTYSDAVQELPEELVAGMPRSLLEVGIWHASDATGRFDSDDYGWVQQQKRFDWKAFLAYVHRDKGAGAVDSGDSIEKENAISSAESKKTAEGSNTIVGQTQKKDSTSDSSPVSTLDVVEPTETEAISDQERVGFESPDDTGAE